MVIMEYVDHRCCPPLRLSIFRTPQLAAANLAQLLLGAAWIPMWFYLNLYLQQVLGYTAFPSGAGAPDGVVQRVTTA